MGDRLPRPRPKGSPDRRNRVRIAMVAAGVLVLVAGIVVAWQRPGFAQVPPQPVDDSVWVMNNHRVFVGRINTGIGQLDSAAALRGSSAVLQDPAGHPADPVFVIDESRHELQALDTTTVTLGTRVSLPDSPVLAYRSGTLAVADRVDGRLWVGSATDPTGVDVDAAQPVVTVGASPVVAVGVDGTVHATRPGASDVVTIVPGSDPTTTSLPDGPLSLGNPASGSSATGPSGDIQISAVGATAVVLDRADSALRVDGRRIALPDHPDAVLQQPGPAAAEVLLSTSDGLLAVDLTDGAVRTVADGAGTPVAPVVAGGCAYAAWSGARGATVTGLAVCGAGPGQPVTLTGTGTRMDLTLTARGTAAVLADGTTGFSWVASDGFRTVDNWDDVAPLDGQVENRTTEEKPTDSKDLPRVPPDCTAVSPGDPQAADDTFGVRAGRTTVLRVLDNDPSVDCTSVAVESVSPLPAAVGTVAVVGNGAALQVTVKPGVTTIPVLTYQVGNGRGGTASAHVTITVSAAAVTTPPQPVRRSAVSVEVGGTVSYNVLDDMMSPTGDDLYLVSAVTDGPDAVSFRPDGTVTYRNTGAGAGTDASVEFVVSDGVEQATGTLAVSVVAAGSGVPLAYPAHARTVLGTPAVVDLRRSVVSGSPEPVEISSVQPESAADPVTVRIDDATGTVTVGATAPGSYYFTFEAAAGGRGTTGVLRVDVGAAGDGTAAAVPMLDVAYLPAGGEAVIDPTANDTDPDGQGLAVQQVVATDAGAATVAAAVVDLHLVRISAARPLRSPVDLSYTVFDGANAPTGTIRVVPVPEARAAPPPLAQAARATVRAGDVATIPITRFTTSQDGTPVTVTVDPAQVAALPGRVLVTADAIRYLAPADAAAGQVTFGYTASSGSATTLAPAQSAGTVTITVVAADPDHNRPPGPPPTVTARVFAGSGITISVPLAGVDPDGDWVTLQSIEQPEAPLGEIQVTGSDTLSYTAFDAPGVDRIRYVAADPSGATVTGEVTVLVVTPIAAARPPVAPDLAVSVRPGGTIRIDPVASVADPGGLPVTLDDPAFTATEGLDLQVEDDSLILTAPAEPTVGTVRYQVVNSKGLTASGSVRVTVSPDAPMPDPVAQDVFVQPSDLKADTDTVDVDVSGSITNRSGRAADLTVAVDELSAGGAVLAGPRTIRVTVSSARQIVAYRVTDGYGGQAGAFIVVPPRQQLYGPQLRSGVGPIDVDAGRSVDVTIGDYVTVGGANQDSVTIAAQPALRVTQGSASRTSSTTLTLSAPSDAGGSAALYVPIAVGGDPPVVLSIPVRIEPRLIPPPKLDSSDLAVEAGTSASMDLARLTTTYDDRQASSLDYAIGDGSTGIGTAVQGSTVTVTAAADTPRGTRLELPIQVTDGDGKVGKATLTVTVSGSTKPLPTVVDQQIGQGRGGVAVAADMLTGSLDPVGLGLTVTGTRVVDGAAGIATGPTVDGGTVRLTPTAGFVGEIVVAVDVMDGTKDPDRQVTATLRVQIQDRPAAPGVPAAVPGTVSARSVQLQWEPADANGAVVQTYTVTGGGVRQDCPGTDTTCVIEGLTPGQAYVFAVTATNSVGTSDPSAPSAVIVPDVIPTVPAAPTVQYRARGEVSVGWTVPTGDFTAVTGMTLQVLRGDDVVQTVDGATSPTVLSGLDSAGSYRFQVRATNQQGSSDWSAASDPIVPSGVPGAPTGLSAQFVPDTGHRGIQVGWAAPADDGGEPIQSYRLRINGSEVASGDSTWLSAFVPVDGNDPVAVTVVARNSRGDGPAAGPVTVTPFTRPGQVTGLRLTPGDSSLAATWDAVAGAAEYQYRLNNGGWAGAGSGTSATIGSLANGTKYTVQVRACGGQAGASDDDRCGPASAAATATPFGPLAAPTVKVAPAEKWSSTLTVTWSFPGGNGRDVTERSVTITGADTQTGQSGTVSVPTDWGKSVTATAHYCVGTGAAKDCQDATATGSTATLFAVATQKLEPLAGTCAVAEQYPGEWRTQANCAPGTWVAAPKAADLLCVATGVAYPEFPAGNPAPTPFKTVNQWYLDKNHNWYRKPVLVSPDSQIPTC